ncbi:hypothetical protein C2845_PM18G10480 [Panicum miliaceum]|uniref:F-box domain-containing protein n=1 Tax=Panicum miliaceum TaxID=4540 RepID=A0A3L6PLH0_PANMI|nr:hypothetical protein C2845_PM18G10480 [Panicum miliaceum]
MDSGEGTPADQTRHAPLPLVAAAQARCSTRCVPGLPAPPRLDDVSEPRHRPWADLPADILGVVVGRLALVEDRARLRSVCHAWRAAARLHRRLPPPLPLLVLSDFSFSSFRAEGTVTGARRRVPLPGSETAGMARGRGGRPKPRHR